MKSSTGAAYSQITLVALAILALVGCTGQQRMADTPAAVGKEQQAHPTVSSAATPEKTPLSNENQVRLAVFVDWLTKYENRLKAPSAPPAVTCYLHVEADGKVTDPDEVLMAALLPRPFLVKKGSFCTKHGYGVVDNETGKAGNYLLTIGAIKWIEPDVAELKFDAYQNGRSATYGKMQVGRQDGSWKAKYVGAVVRS